MNAPTFYPAHVAQAKAAALQAGDPEWTYTVIHLPNGLARIQVEDEDGIILDAAGYFG